MKKFLLLAGPLASLHIAASQAALTYFEAARWRNFTQNSNAQPTVHNGFQFTGRVFSNSANEVQDGTVETPLSTVYNMTPAGAFITAYSHGGFPTEAALNAVYPMGPYTFTLTNGPRAGDSDTMVYNDPGWPNAVPYLTGSLYSDLQGADVTKPITFNWSSFESTGTSTGTETYFYLRNLTTNTTVFGEQGKPDTFRSKTLTANSLVAGDEYQFQLVFGVLEQAATTGDLAPAAWTGAKYFGTSGRFRTALPIVPVGPIDIQISGNTATISWAGSGFLERSPNLVTWTIIAGATNPYTITISPNDPALYFRQRIP
jgi:hypothetical protein